MSGASGAGVTWCGTDVDNEGASAGTFRCNALPEALPPPPLCAVEAGSRARWSEAVVSAHGEAQRERRGHASGGSVLICSGLRVHGSAIVSSVQGTTVGGGRRDKQAWTGRRS